VKTAIVGCGLIARTHAKVLKKDVLGADLIFCDRNQDKADSYASQFSTAAPAYTDYAAMLEKESPHAVHILTQPASHVELAKAALDAGAHLYIEKPVTESLTEFNELQALADEKQLILYPGYSTLGYPILHRARNIMASGKMGELVSVHCDFNVAPAVGKIPYGREDHWAYSLEGGILENVVDHPMSLLADTISGPVLHDVCVLKRAKLPQDSPNLMHATVMNDSQIGSFTLSYANGNAYAYVTYFLEAGTLRVDLRNFILTTEYGTGPQSFPSRFVSGLKISAGLAFSTVGMAIDRVSGRTAINPGIRGLITNFYAVARGEAEPLVSRDVARGIVRLLEGIWTFAGRTSDATRTVD
jgi:predicted dehydrogenase